MGQKSVKSTGGTMTAVLGMDSSSLVKAAEILCRASPWELQSLTFQSGY